MKLVLVNRCIGNPGCDFKIWSTVFTSVFLTEFVLTCSPNANETNDLALRNQDNMAVSFCTEDQRQPRERIDWRDVSAEQEPWTETVWISLASNFGIGVKPRHLSWRLMSSEGFEQAPLQYSYQKRRSTHLEVNCEESASNTEVRLWSSASNKDQAVPDLRPDLFLHSRLASRRNPRGLDIRFPRCIRSAIRVWCWYKGPGWNQ